MQNSFTAKIMTIKLLLTLFLTTLLLTSCGGSRNTTAQKTPNHYGVLINGIRWATRNVDAPGTLAQNPEDAGMLFQWNRRKGWNDTSDFTGWDSSSARANSNNWTRANDPCPTGWRVPTRRELRSLSNTPNKWTTRNGVYGRLFGATPYQVFLPAAGLRRRTNGELIAEGEGYYWSRTGFLKPGFLVFHNTSVSILNSLNFPAHGFSVRCVSIN